MDEVLLSTAPTEQNWTNTQSNFVCYEIGSCRPIVFRPDLIPALELANQISCLVCICTAAKCTYASSCYQKLFDHLRNQNKEHLMPSIRFDSRHMKNGFKDMDTYMEFLKEFGYNFQCVHKFVAFDDNPIMWTPGNNVIEVTPFRNEDSSSIDLIQALQKAKNITKTQQCILCSDNISYGT